jgi:hypothetical protein
MSKIVPAADTHYFCWTCLRLEPPTCDRAPCPSMTPEDADDPDPLQGEGLEGK